MKCRCWFIFSYPKRYSEWNRARAGFGRRKQCFFFVRSLSFSVSLYFDIRCKTIHNMVTLQFCKRFMFISFEFGRHFGSNFVFILFFSEVKRKRNQKCRRKMSYARDIYIHWYPLVSMNLFTFPFSYGAKPFAYTDFENQATI